MRPLPEPATTGLGGEYDSFDRNGKSKGKAYANIDYFTVDQVREHCAAEIRPLVEALRAYERAGFGNSTDFALRGEAYNLSVAALAGQEPLPVQAEPIGRALLEQYDLEQSPEYRKGYEDGRLKGYEVGHRHACDAATQILAAHGITGGDA